ncbi:Polygalacturonase inhibitor 2 [Platanthera zijinensis]|uniref:Polygalacturonase inhibitor 2 n=1 Tax=Platanthera zijinensis TaxID=2320716 RepID=A0AAP0G3N5_9ASPA
MASISTTAAVLPLLLLLLLPWPPPANATKTTSAPSSLSNRIQQRVPLRPPGPPPPPAATGTALSAIPASPAPPAGLRSLVITDSNVSGPIPPAVGDLPYLTSLRFHKLPFLSATSPPPLPASPPIRLLLSWNSLSGPISPFSISNPFSHHRRSLLQPLLGSIPAELANLPALLGLDFSRNRITGSIPALLWELSQSVPAAARLQSQQPLRRLSA